MLFWCWKKFGYNGLADKVNHFIHLIFKYSSDVGFKDFDPAYKVTARTIILKSYMLALVYACTPSHLLHYSTKSIKVLFVWSKYVLQELKVV